jgi:sulfur carrier protein ThiS
MAAEDAGTQVRVLFGGAMRLVLGQAEATVRVSHGRLLQVMDALAAGEAGAPPLGVDHCLAIVNGRVVPRGEWATTVLAAGATVTVYPPLAGGCAMEAPGVRLAGAARERAQSTTSNPRRRQR